jgi:2'-5' RNA ligase
VQSYATRWAQFTRLEATKDSLAADRRGLRRWLSRPYITFIVPIEDQAVVGQIARWQDALRPWLSYEPQPANGLHITLHYVGGLRHRVWLPHTWRRAAVVELGERVRDTLESQSPFTVQIGPLNAFPNVLIAEVHDEQECLRVLRVKLRRVLPLRARPVSPWPYLPHITLGYWGEQFVAPVIEAMQPWREITPLPVRAERVRLTIYALEGGPPRPDALLTAEEEIITEFVLKGQDGRN